MNMRASRFSIISELTVKLLRSGCSYVEIPGYLQAGPKVRRTVTVRNLLEVIGSYLSLLYEIHVRSRGKFAGMSRRVIVDFVDVDHPVAVSENKIAAK